MRRIGIFLGLFFLWVVLLSCFIVSLFNTYFLQVRSDLGVWPSNQDVMFLFHAFDSFPVI